MTRAAMAVGLIGLGAINQAVVALAREHGIVGIDLVAALVRDLSRPRPEGSPPTVTTLDELLALCPTVFVEAGGHGALRAHGPAVLRAGHDLLLVSVGALADAALERELRAAAAAGGAQMKIISGAIGALDALAAAALGGLTRVTHTTRKPASTLLGSADAAQLTRAREIFHGTAREGALVFPESINVAAAVSLAGLGFDRTEVRVLADPGVDRNQHEVVAEGAFGTFQFSIQNIPSVANARTGRLVAMSVLHALLQRRATIVIG